MLNFNPFIMKEGRYKKYFLISIVLLFVFMISGCEPQLSPKQYFEPREVVQKEDTRDCVIPTMEWY